MGSYTDSQDHYAVGGDVYWTQQLVTITGIANYKIKKMELVNHVAMLKNVFHIWTDSGKVDGYYLHLGTPKGMWDKIAIYSKSIIEIRRPTRPETILYKLEYEDIIGEDKVMRDKQNSW